jgi:hypothetical protein
VRVVSLRYLAIDRDSVGQGTCRSSSTIEGIAPRLTEPSRSSSSYVLSIEPDLPAVPIRSNRTNPVRSVPRSPALPRPVRDTRSLYICSNAQTKCHAENQNLSQTELIPDSVIRFCRVYIRERSSWCSVKGQCFGLMISGLARHVERECRG